MNTNLDVALTRILDVNHSLHVLVLGEKDHVRQLALFHLITCTKEAILKLKEEIKVQSE